MSWLARSLVNTLRGEEENEAHNRHEIESETDEEEEEEEEEARGVKEDLTELTQTLTRQFWGVASFLAPPPPSEPSPSDPYDQSAGDAPSLDGIRSDLAEIGGRFRSGISMLSNAKAVSEISKIASSLLPFRSEGEGGEGEEIGEGAVGVTDDVVAFVRSVSMHPETWLDFPLVPDDSEAFDMSDAQQEHALAVERLAPSLAALRIELCPSHMSESHFWKIYFVLLHSRLSEEDSDVLSTPQIMQARATLLQDLPRTKPASEGSGRGVSPSYEKEDVPLVPQEVRVGPSETSSAKTETYEDSLTSIPITDLETDKHPVQITEVKIVDKSVIEENLPALASTKDIQSDVIQKCEEDGDGDGDGDGDDWLKEETGDSGGTGGGTIPLGNDEDVSFSDLEDD